MFLAYKVTPGQRTFLVSPSSKGIRPQSCDDQYILHCVAPCRDPLILLSSVVVRPKLCEGVLSTLLCLMTPCQSIFLLFGFSCHIILSSVLLCRVLGLIIMAHWYLEISHNFPPIISTVYDAAIYVPFIITLHQYRCRY